MPVSLGPAKAGIRHLGKGLLDEPARKHAVVHIPVLAIFGVAGEYGLHEAIAIEPRGVHIGPRLEGASYLIGYALPLAGETKVED